MTVSTEKKNEWTLFRECFASCLRGFGKAWKSHAKKLGLFLALWLAVTGIIIFANDWEWQRAASGWRMPEWGIDNGFRKSFCSFLKEYGDFHYFNIGLTVVIYLVGVFRKSKYLRRVALCFALVSASAGFTVQSSKSLFGRPRPRTVLKQEDADAYKWRGPTVKGGWRSYPSGHTAATTAPCLLLAILLPRLAIPAIIFALLVAWSRVWGDYHYPLDVVHSMGIGAFWAILWAKAAEAPEDEPESVTQA
ncbi:MAG: phosphatase PAP2 family protein [Verrucomicrobiota bacterium JB023]|nr:phosphatase PAP2 family protein [Verrucomicrobiota bacterium JB023]